MSTSKTLILALSAAMFTVACGGGSDEASPDSGPSFTNPDASVRTDAGSGGGGGDTGTVTTEDPDGGVVGEGEDGGETEVDPDSGAVVSCDGPGGCYACTPKTNLQFLNQCVSNSAGITAVPFDNQVRIPGYVPGTLPTLP